MYNQSVIVESQTSTPWLRLYNKFTRLHHWTASNAEYEFLGILGWVKEGVTGYLFESQIDGTVPLFRLYNANNSSHHWTVDPNEKAGLVSLGWMDEWLAMFLSRTSK